MKKIKLLLSKISTKPRKSSYVWKGNKSCLAFILLNLIWLCRMVSVLQWVKYVYRKWKEWKNKATIDEGAKRINVPPMVVELYFIICGVILSIIYFCDCNCIAMSAVSAYFVFESFVWIIYYAIFRRFYEENYKIHHILEYFVVIILVLPLQALASANIYNMEFSDILLGILGVSEVKNCMMISIFSVIYQAIVIGIIISSFPSEKTKVGIYPEEKNIIIGCGNVVKNKLIPALASHNNISVYDIKSSFIAGGEQDVNLLNNDSEIIDGVKKEISSDSIVWISTPSYAHINYLNKILDMNKDSLIVMEKPITARIEELDCVKSIIANDKKRKKIFFLSYYMLEKALPLYYFVENNLYYTKYLSFDNVGYGLANMGRMQSVYVKIYEGNDNRSWIYEYGGQECETFLHNILVATLFVGLPQLWDNIEWKKENDKIHLSARKENVDISLEQAKNVCKKECGRYALIQYQNGSLKMDFETQTLTINNKKYNGKGKIYVKEEYKNKYAIQTDLVRRVYTGEISCEDVDGLKNQLECIEWLLNVI